MSSLVIRRALSRALFATVAAVLLFGFWTGPAAADDSEPTGTGVVDESSGRWWLRDPVTHESTSFYYGNPGDFPFMGDWNCDGTDTPGLYRQSDGFVYLRNSSTQGNADIKFFFGNPGDVPLAGDFDGDGCDTVSIYRPSEGRFYIIDKLGENGGGLGAAETDFLFGNRGDNPYVGDFDGDGIDTVGLHRESSGLMYFRNTNSEGSADVQFTYGDPGDRAFAGDWDGDGTASVGIFRPSKGMMYLRYENSSGPADEAFEYGGGLMFPVAGVFGPLVGWSEPPPRDMLLVSEFTTYHSCCQNRVINIQLIADTIDGAIVQPGETFSINQHVGQRTTGKGYVVAGAIIGGEIVYEGSPINIGGGTSQFATTLYNAAFFGGYEDVYHKPHSLYFSRYPLGREATLSWPGPDVIFRNDTGTPVRIDTSHTSTSITVRLYGNNEGREVTAGITGWATSRDGGTVTVSRTIRLANGNSETEYWRHTYNPMP